MIQLLLNKTTPPFQLLPMPKVDQSLLRIHEAPPLQKAKSQVIQTNVSQTIKSTAHGAEPFVLCMVVNIKPQTKL